MRIDKPTVTDYTNAQHDHSNAANGGAIAGGGGTVTHTAGDLTANQVVIGNAAADLKVLGSLGTTTTVLHGNAAGAPTFGAVDLAADVTGNLPVTNLNSGTNAGATTFWRGDGSWVVPAGGGTVTHTAGALTANAVMLGAGTDDSKVLASLGTTTTLLHGNAAGAPSFAAVDLAADVTGNLPVTNLNSGTNAGATTFWRGDGSWQTPSGGGAVTLLGQGEGTDTSAGATTVFSLALSGLTVKDSLKIVMTASSLTQTTTVGVIKNTTDNVTIAQWDGGVNLVSGAFCQEEGLILTDQSSSKTVMGFERGFNTNNGAFGVGTKSTFTTDWTGSWTIGLTHGGVTAGGTFRYRIAVYKIAGQ